MLPWLFNIMDGCMREMKAKVGNVGARPKMNGMGQAVLAFLFAYDTALICLQRVKRNFKEWWMNYMVYV